MTKEQFKQIRKTMEWSVTKCADYLRVSDRTVRYWERGERTIPGPVEKLMEQAEINKTVGE